MPDPVYPTIYVDGPAKIYIGAAVCNANAYAAPGSSDVELGFTETGLQISLNTLTHRVNSDDCGGSEGNPAEILYMGATGNVRGTLVKYFSGAFAALANGLYATSGTPGALVKPGTALFAGGYGCAVWAIGANGSFYFPKCEMASAPREFNISATERKTSFSFTAYPTQNGSNNACNYYLYFTGAGDPSVLCACSAVNGVNAATVIS